MNLAPTGGRRRARAVLLGVALVAVGVGAWLVSTSYPTPPGARVVGGNVPVNAGAADLRDISAHNSPTLVRSPIDPSRLAVANRIDSPLFSCALHLSSDGGATWRELVMPLPDGEEPKCFAPDASFGADGSLHVAFVTLRGHGNVPNAVWLTSVAPGGVKLSPPVRALGPLAFQVRLSADPGRPGRLYLTWLQATETGYLALASTGNPLQLSRSDDGGRTWTEPARVSGQGRARVVAPSPAIGPDGEIYVVYLDLRDDRLDYAGGHQGRGGDPYPGVWHLVLARSDDRGATWIDSVIDDGVVPTERFIVFLPPAPSLAVDPGNGDLFATFTDGRLGDADVWVWRSTDGGITWGAPARVNDTRRADGTSQYLPKLAVAPGGRVDVVYYDRRADVANVMNEVSLQSSFDGGRTFGPSVRISDRPFSSLVGFGSERDMPDLGSRLALLSTAERSLAVWSDTRAGTEASRKQDLVRALVEIDMPRRLPSGVDALLRAGGAVAAVMGVVFPALGWVRGRGGDGQGSASPDVEDGSGMAADVDDDARAADVLT